MTVSLSIAIVESGRPLLHAASSAIVVVVTLLDESSIASAFPSGFSLPHLLS